MIVQTIVAAFLAATPVQADTETCLKPDEARAIVLSDKLIELAEATRLARGKAQGDVVSANLCRVNGRMMYVLAILARGGRVVRIGVDAQSRAVHQLR